MSQPTKEARGQTSPKHASDVGYASLLTSFAAAIECSAGVAGARRRSRRHPPWGMFAQSHELGDDVASVLGR